MSRPFSLVLLALALAFIAYAAITADTPSRPRPVVTDSRDVEPTLTPGSSRPPDGLNPTGSGSSPTVPGPTSLDDVFIRYRSCEEARDAGDFPLKRGDAGYRRGLDRDGDGVACEVAP